MRRPRVWVISEAQGAKCGDPVNLSVNLPALINQPVNSARPSINRAGDLVRPDARGHDDRCAQPNPAGAARLAPAVAAAAPAGAPRRPRQAADQLYRAMVEQARRPAFYRELGVPDTPEGRFEMIALHAALVLRRLRREGLPGQALGQALFDLMFADLDAGLRELGVGDLGVGTYIKRLAGQFYARLAALDEGLGDAGPAGSQHGAAPPMLRANV